MAENAGTPSVSGITAVMIDIAPMRRRHVPAVIAIEKQVYPRPWSRALLLGELDLKTSRAYIVARDGRRVVGYAGIMLVGDEGHITTIAVDPNMQRSAIGMRLMLALAKSALERAANSMTLEVRASNRAAQSLYKRYGFVSVGARKGYYQDNAEDAFIMWVRNIDSPEYGELLSKYAARYASSTRIELPRIISGATQ